jgi:hypothetical protein
MKIGTCFEVDNQAIRTGICEHPNMAPWFTDHEMDLEGQLRRVPESTHGFDSKTEIWHK